MPVNSICYLHYKKITLKKEIIY